MARFTLRLEMENEAMSAPADVVEALRAAAEKLEAGATYSPIRDRNGNTVGLWEYLA